VEGDKRIVISAESLYEILLFKTPKSLDLGSEISIISGGEHGGGEEEVDPHRK